MSKRLLTLFVLLAASLCAQSVRWEPDSGTLAFSQSSELRLVFDQCEPEGDITLPAIPGLSVSTPPSVSRQIVANVINFRASSSKIITYTYRVRPTERLNVTIPVFTVKTDKGVLSVPSASFTIGDATVGQSNVSLNDVAEARLILPNADVWQGEVFDVRYNLVIRGNRAFRASNNLNWNKAPLSTESWSAPVETKSTTGARPETITTQTTRAYAPKPGVFKIEPVDQEVIIATSQDIFGRATGENFTITSPSASLTVKPLPSPAPAGFTGAVGQFALSSKLVPATASVGEPLTWTLTLDGTGNWPDIGGLPPRSVSKDFRVVQPQAKRTAKADSLFDASITEDIVLIPTKPGIYTLGPVALTVFNPATGDYETLSTQPVTITVAGTPSTASVTPPSASSDLQPKLPSPTVSAAPAALPLDPLPSAGTATAPLSPPTLITLLAVATLLPLSAWTILARGRALVTDPARPLREARIRLADTLRSLEGATSGSLFPALQSWQRDTAILFRLPQAVPTSADLGVAASAGEWSVLWSEADRTLYGTTPLPADWVARATAALAAHRIPQFSSFQLFLPRNLLPLLLLFTSLVCFPSPTRAAEGGSAAYARADYPAAEKAWRASLAASPADWTSRHNLSLALIQQNRPGEAAGQALAAFVQHPQNDSVRRTLAYACKAAGLTPPPVAQLTRLNAQLASLASPTRWQFLLIASAWLCAVATALGIHAAYTRRPRKLLVGTVLAVSLLLAASAGVSLGTYGPLADARAVVVVTPTTLRSIPTDLDTQKTTPLALGVIAARDKTFLGWTRLTFPEGQTGWVRTETVVILWR